MRRRVVLIGLQICSSLVLLPVAINVGTGGTLPKPLHFVRGYAWLIIVVLEDYRKLNSKK